MIINKKNIIIIVGGVAAFLAVAGSVFFLIVHIRQLSVTETKLAQSLQALKNFYAKDPFPSKENVEQEKKNVQALEASAGKLLASLKAGEIKAIQTTPSGFIDLLGKKSTDLTKRAKEAGTSIPKTFAFGFEKYCATDNPSLPQVADLPTLCQQLSVIELVCGIMFDEKAKEITKIMREDVEKVSTTPAVPAGDGAAPEAGAVGVDVDAELRNVLHFTIEFKAKEISVLNILNEIAKSKVFMVATSVKFEKDGADVVPAALVGTRKSRDDDDVVIPAGRTNAVAALTDKNIPRDERLMCGPKIEKPMKIKLALDVYRFAGE